MGQKLNFFFSLDKSIIDERIRKDIMDYITIRVQESPIISSNITPLSPSSGGCERKGLTSINNSPSMSPQHAYMSPDDQQNNPLASAQARFTQHLTDASKGCFLFAKLVGSRVRYKDNDISKTIEFLTIQLTKSNLFHFRYLT